MQEAAKSDAFFPKPSRASSPYHTSSVQSSPFIMELHLGHTILITIFELGKWMCRGYYIAARRYEFYFRVVITIFYERAQRENSYLQAAA